MKRNLYILFVYFVLAGLWSFSKISNGKADKKQLENFRTDNNINTIFTVQKYSSREYDKFRKELITAKEEYRISINSGEWVNPRELPSDLSSFTQENHLSNQKTSYISKPSLFANSSSVSVKICRIEKKRKSETVYLFFTDKEHELPVVVLNTDEKNFFGFNKGIYVEGKSVFDEPVYKFMIPWWEMPANYHQRGSDWERKVHVQVFENGTCSFETDAGVRIHGNASRAFPQKSLRLVAGKKYNRKSFKFDFYKSEKAGVHERKSIILRNGGNDWGKTLFADGFIHTEFADTSYEQQNYRPCVVYLNGEYWGIHSFRDRIDEENLSLKYGVKKDDITVLEGNLLASGSPDDRLAFKNMVTQSSHLDMKADSNFHKIIAELNYPGFLKYLAVQLYAANSDWPANNMKCFRINSEKTLNRNKWTWVLWDMDYAYSYTGSDAADSDMFAKIRGTKCDFSTLFSNLLKNKIFKSDLRNELLTLLNNHSVPNQLQHIDEFAKELESEMENHVRRWRKPKSVDEWGSYVNGLKDFVQRREAVIRSQIKKYLE